MANMIQILTGNFSKGENSKGNFSGYDSEGNRIFIFKAQMESLGMTKDADFKSFYALVANKPIQTRDADGELTDVLTDRLQATAVFKTEAELYNAKNSSARLQMGAMVDLQKTATSAGLSDAQVQALLEVAI
jgi:hypothetical protein